MVRIADILSQARKQLFTGCAEEIRWFQQLIASPDLETHVVFIYGPGGQGKTTLLKEFMELCRVGGYPFAHVNGQELMPSTSDFYEALMKELNVASIKEMNEVLEKSSNTFVLFIDTYEKLHRLDEWLRQEFLPALPENVLTVIAGRDQPGFAWTSDPGWQMLMKTLQLRNFSPVDSRTYLQKRGVPVEHYDEILEFTQGHPLALSLVTDMMVQNPGKNFSPGESPDIVQTLLGHFLQKVPSAAHKTAVEICAMAYVVTESLLASVMGLEDAAPLFEWLKGLSFIESNRLGLYPHEQARETINADLKWRNPDWFKHLYKKIKAYYVNKLETASGEEQRKYLIKLNYLYRNHPSVKPFYLGQENADCWVDLLKMDDVQPLARLTEKFEGSESAKAFKYWVNHPAARVFVWRRPQKPHSGFLMRININELDREEKIKDPVMQNVVDYANTHFHLRKDNVCAVFRFWMADQTYQDVSAIQSSIFLHLTQYYLTAQGLAINLISTSQPEFWKGFLNYYNLEHIPLLDYSTGKANHGFYMHDWRIIPPVAWINLLGEEAPGDIPDAIEAQVKTQVAVLSEAEFFDGVYEALKDYHSETKLESNPLTRSKFVLNIAGFASMDGKCTRVLREKLDEALKKIEESPRDGKFHRILYRTFINPVGSQEQTADFLSLPFSTYRRHLKKAVSMVSDALWLQEVRN